MSFHRRVDSDIHRLIGIRLVDPPIAAEAAVRKSMGLRVENLNREPDLTIRFVSSIRSAGLRFLGQGQYAYSEEDFFIFNRHHKGTLTRIPFDRLGDPCEITTDSAHVDLGLLLDIIKLVAIRKQHAPVHGSAFVLGGQPILMSSWAKGGKTTALLGFVAKGADFVGDDCILLSGQGERMYGIPRPLELSHRHLEALPSIRSRIDLTKRARVAAMASVQKAERLLGVWQPSDSAMGDLTKRGISFLQNRLSVRVSPLQALGSATRLWSTSPTKVFLLVSHQKQEVEVQPVRLSPAITRIVASVLEDQKALREHYMAFRYAFPDRHNPVIENEAELLREILLLALSKSAVYEIRHPYPIRISDFSAVVGPYCERTADPCPETLSTAANECAVASVTN